ncbi:hypothetical protein KY308_01845, partial [Candidatus Woesearchaeota archaeon]|nr:hypothetical protein [Candidatus Woesearchaeota archaeon]
SDQFRGNSQKIADDIFYTFKIHEIKGHTGFGTVEDEERAMLTEIAEANSMYPIYRVWEMTSNKDSDWLHKKASMLAMEELAKYKNSQGRNYEGEVLARANLAKIKNVAGQILKNKF